MSGANRHDTDGHSSGSLDLIPQSAIMTSGVITCAQVTDKTMVPPAPSLWYTSCHLVSSATKTTPSTIRHCSLVSSSKRKVGQGHGRSSSASNPRRNAE
eukprot:scaffold8927_cov176-Amphora_coffeaeformis.AAC.10